jgi:hypothetical protein
LLAFDEVSVYNPVILVLTDLNEFWQLFWLEAPNLIRDQILTRKKAMGFLRWHLCKFDAIIKKDKFALGSPKGSDNDDNANRKGKKKDNENSSSFPSYKATKYSALNLQQKQGETVDDIGRMDDFLDYTAEDKRQRAYKRMMIALGDELGMFQSEDSLNSTIGDNYALEKWKTDGIQKKLELDSFGVMPSEA